MRFSCDHCGRVYAVSDELSGRTFRMKCKACGEAILVHGQGREDGLGDEPIGVSPSISVLHAVDPGATARTEAAVPSPRPAPPPDVNPFVAQPITVARVAAAVDGSIAAAAAEAMAPVPRPPPARHAPDPVGPSVAPEEQGTVRARSEVVDDLRRSLDGELAPDGGADVEEFEVVDRPEVRPVARLRDPVAREGVSPRSGTGPAGRRPSDGEGAMALASFTEPAVASVRQARAPEREDVAGRRVPEPVQEFEAPFAPAARSRRNPLLVGLGLALAVGLAVGLVVARRGGDALGSPAPVASPSPPPPPAVAPVVAAREVPAEAAVATPAPVPAARPEAKPALPPVEAKPGEAGERAAQKKGARARRQEVGGTAPSGAEGVVPRGGLLDDDGSRTPAGGEGTASPSVARRAETSPEPVREPVPDAPRYVSSGFRSPRLAQADCLSETLRLPPQAAAMVAGPVTVKFAVYPDGHVDQLQVMNKLPDPRIGEAVARAIRACEWVPGADAEGTPTPLWVVQPLRFAP